MGVQAKKIERLGLRYGLLVVIRDVTEKGCKYAKWECRCDCGAIRIVPGYNLATAKSCGCARRKIKQSSPPKRTPRKDRASGYSRLPSYNCYQAMMRRCYKTEHKDYKKYGAVGIVVCDRWRYGQNGLTGFECFNADMGPRPSKAHTLDRTRGDPVYSPETCRWADPFQQGENRKNNVIVWHGGKAFVAGALARENGVNASVFIARIRKGISVKAALVPKRARNRTAHASK